MIVDIVMTMGRCDLLLSGRAGLEAGIDPPHWDQTEEPELATAILQACPQALATGSYNGQRLGSSVRRFERNPVMTPDSSEARNSTPVEEH